MRYVAMQMPEEVSMCFDSSLVWLTYRRPSTEGVNCEIVRLLGMIVSTSKVKLSKRNDGEQKTKLLKVVSTHACSEDKL